MTADTEWAKVANSALVALGGGKKSKKAKKIKESAVLDVETRFGALAPWGGPAGGGAMSPNVEDSDGED